MSVSEKLITVSENQERVFEAGKKSEYDAFWDELQNYGQPKSYANAFSNSLWNDKTYNPKYPFKIRSCNNMFMENTGITDTKVPLDFRGNKGQIYYVFENAKNLVTIRKIILDETNQTFSRWFNNCTSLKNITFEGTIKKSIDFSSCPLTVESMIDVITHLERYENTENEDKYTVSFSDSCWQALENSDYNVNDYFPDVVSWADACGYVGWNI